MTLDDEAASDLLGDPLDHWATGGAAPEWIANILQAVGSGGSVHSHSSLTPG